MSILRVWAWEFYQRPDYRDRHFSDPSSLCTASDIHQAFNIRRSSFLGSWRILALERSELHKKCTLLCVSEYDETVYLRAVLNMDHEKDRFQRKQLEVLDWEIETSTAEAILEEAKGYNRRSTKRDRLIREYVKILYPHNQVYFMESLDEEVAPGYTAITEIEWYKKFENRIKSDMIYPR